MSVRGMLGSLGYRVPPSHKSVSSYQELYGEDIFSKHVGYALIRNPLDRLVSSYFFGQRNCGLKERQEGSCRDLFGANSFAEFVVELHRNFERYSERIFIVMPQHFFIAGINGDVPVKLFPFETINRFATHVAEEYFSKEQYLPKRNTTDHEHFMSYYNNEMIDMALEMYGDDMLLYETVATRVIEAGLRDGIRISEEVERFIEDTP